MFHVILERENYLYDFCSKLKFSLQAIDNFRSSVYAITPESLSHTIDRESSHGNSNITCHHYENLPMQYTEIFKVVKMKSSV